MRTINVPIDYIHPSCFYMYLLRADILYISINVYFYRFGEVFGPQTQPDTEEFTDFYAGILNNNGNLVWPG